MIKDWIVAVLILYFAIPKIAIGQDIHDPTPYRVQLEAVKLPDLLDALEKSYNVQFSYASNLLEDEVFSLKTNTIDLSDILKEITAIYPLEYQILGNQSILLRDRLIPEPIEGDQLIQLRIIDQSTDRPLSEVAVGIRGSTYGDYSNADGLVNLLVPSESDSIFLDVHLLGYQPASVLYNNNFNAIVELSPQVFMVDEVMIKDRVDVMKINSSDHHVELSTTHISSFTAGLSGSDVMRQAQLLPGIASYDDKSSGLKIRGAAEESSLIMLDDIPIYNASHYYGLFSSINPVYASSSTLYKNNLPVTYDGKTAGMLKINGPVPDSSQMTHGSLELNLLTLSGAVSIPLSNNLSWTFAGRSSYQNASDTDFFSLFSNKEQENATVENFSLSSRDKLLSTVPDFTFFDVNSKLYYQWGQNNLEFNYYQSSDDLDDIFENEFKTRKQQVVVLNKELYNNSEDWQNQGFNLKLNYSLSDQLSLSSIAYSTNYTNVSGLEIALSRQFLRETRTFNYSNFRENKIRDIGVKNTLNYFNSDLAVDVGLEVVNHKVDMGVFEQDKVISQTNAEKVETSAFVSVSPYINSNLLLELGFRSTLFDEKIYPSPRINFSYLASDNWTLKSSIGRHNQFVRQISFENIFGRSLDFWILSENKGLAVSKADQLMAGATFKKDRFSFDIESYYRYRYNLVELAFLNPRFDEASILPLANNNGNAYRPFTGNSQTYGIDIMFSVTYPKYSGWVAYTLSKSETQYDQILNGTSFPSQDDRRHQLKWINEYRLGDFILGANLLYASGRPYTDLNKVASALRRDELGPNDRLSRLPAYFRTDVGITYRFEFGISSLDVGLSAYNLLNRQNVNYIQYLFSIPTNSSSNPSATINTLLGTESNLLDRTVNLNLSYKF